MRLCDLEQYIKEVIEAKIDALDSKIDSLERIVEAYHE